MNNIFPDKSFSRVKMLLFILSFHFFSLSLFFVFLPFSLPVSLPLTDSLYLVKNETRFHVFSSDQMVVVNGTLILLILSFKYLFSPLSKFSSLPFHLLLSFARQLLHSSSSSSSNFFHPNWMSWLTQRSKKRRDDGMIMLARKKLWEKSFQLLQLSLTLRYLDSTIQRLNNWPQIVCCVLYVLNF